MNILKTILILFLTLMSFNIMVSTPVDFCNSVGGQIEPFKPNEGKLTFSQAHNYCNSATMTFTNSEQTDIYSRCMCSFTPFVGSDSYAKGCAAKDVSWGGSCKASLPSGRNLERVTVENVTTDDDRSERNFFVGQGTFVCSNGQWQVQGSTSSCVKVPNPCLFELDNFNDDWGVTFPSWAVDDPNKRCSISLTSGGYRSGLFFRGVPNNVGQVGVNGDLNALFSDQNKMDDFIDLVNSDIVTSERYFTPYSTRYYFCNDGKVSEDLYEFLRNAFIGGQIDDFDLEDYAFLFQKECHYIPRDCDSKPLPVFTDPNSEAVCQFNAPQKSHPYDFNVGGKKSEEGVIYTSDISYSSIGESHGVFSAQCFDSQWSLLNESTSCYLNPSCGVIYGEIKEKELRFPEYGTVVVDTNNTREFRGSQAMEYFAQQCNGEPGVLIDSTYREFFESTAPSGAGQFRWELIYSNDLPRGSTSAGNVWQEVSLSGAGNHADVRSNSLPPAGVRYTCNAQADNDVLTTYYADESGGWNSPYLYEEYVCTNRNPEQGNFYATIQCSEAEKIDDQPDLCYIGNVTAPPTLREGTKIMYDWQCTSGFLSIPCDGNLIVQDPTEPPEDPECMVCHSLGDGWSSDGLGGCQREVNNSAPPQCASCEDYEMSWPQYEWVNDGISCIRQSEPTARFQCHILNDGGNTETEIQYASCPIPPDDDDQAGVWRSNGVYVGQQECVPIGQNVPLTMSGLSCDNVGGSNTFRVRATSSCADQFGDVINCSTGYELACHRVYDCVSE